MSPVRDHPASLGRQLVEQIRITGRSLRREALALIVILLVLTAIGLFEAIRGGAGLNADPELLLAVLPLALLLPFAIWRAEPAFADAFVWFMPVSRQRVAATKVVAGAFWLLVLVLLVFAWIAALALGSGGSMGETEQRLVGDASTSFTQLELRRWSPPVWLWFVPVFSALIVYLLASAALLGLRHPLRILGVVLFGGAMLLAIVFVASPGGAVGQSLMRWQDLAANGSLGYNVALTAGVSSLSDEWMRADGQTVSVWRDLPSLRSWATAMLSWFAAAVILLLAAIARHRERTG
ncbi:hypothetical protein GRI38_10625 [Altererythrobacter aurantiacus]|uniref:ABC-2 type transport system permease protein n=1 Tax=Parapontixanthobacter aurantiacus TaxID=1463599 RepID=A0A844ZFC7_9SPHN|nr:hypothetical protein [Parapontixanthobacter aurantiacus]MXO86478.1 hypothetical protein [Parapontixanthobacter aurantiacus]